MKLNRTSKIKSNVSYMWLSGHARNVGDSMLRRPYAEALRTLGPIRVWSAAPNSGYEKGLSLSSEEASKSFVSWYAQFVGDVIVRRPRFAFNAGEFGVTKSYFIGMLMILPWIILLKAKGGEIVWLGASIRYPRPGFMWPFRLLARLSTSLAWRDTESTRIMGAGKTMPDWAFGLYQGGGTSLIVDSVPALSERKLLSVALRGDRKLPSAEWLESLLELERRLSLELIFVIQVEDDKLLAESMSRKFSRSVSSWSGDDHLRQERELRSIYRESAIVISDRLHALIMAATEGATPLGWTERDPWKIRIHMDLVGANWVAVREGQKPTALLDSLTIDSLARLWQENAKVVSTAREKVHEIVTVLREQLSR